MKKKLKQRREMGGTRGEVAILNNQVRPFGENDVLAKTDHVNIWHARCRGRQIQRSHHAWQVQRKLREPAGTEEARSEQKAAWAKTGSKTTIGCFKKSSKWAERDGHYWRVSDNLPAKECLNMHWIWIGLFWLQN